MAIWQTRSMTDANQTDSDLPSNQAVLTMPQVLFRRVPALYASHEADDSWRFLSGFVAEVSGGVIIGLGQMFLIDPSLVELANLPKGWCASRADTQSQWVRRQIAPTD